MAIGEKQPTRREIEARATRSKIFHTAINLFSQHGYDKVTVDDIVQYAGVSKGSFYTHFPSKESVLVEQFHLIDDYYEAAFRNVSSQMPASEMLRLLVSTMCKYCGNVCGVNVMKIVYMNQISLGEHENILLDSGERNLYTLLRKIVDQGFETAEFSVSLSKEVLVEYLARFLRSLIYDWCLYDGKQSLEEMGAEYFDTIISWLCMK